MEKYGYYLFGIVGDFAAHLKQDFNSLLIQYDIIYVAFYHAFAMSLTTRCYTEIASGILSAFNIINFGRSKAAHKFRLL